jgi:hypothetical protein
VVYFNHEGRFKHAGLNLGNNRVLSKWARDTSSNTNCLRRQSPMEARSDFSQNCRTAKRTIISDAFARESGMLLDELR